MANMPGRIPDYIAPPPPPPSLPPDTSDDGEPSFRLPTFSEIAATLKNNINEASPNPLQLLAGIPGTAGYAGGALAHGFMQALVNPPAESLMRGPEGEDLRDSREKAISGASEVPILGNLQNLTRNLAYGPLAQQSYAEQFQPAPNEPFLDLSPMWDKNKEGQSMGFLPRAVGIMQNAAPPMAFIPTVVNPNTPGWMKAGAGLLGQDIHEADILPRRVNMPEGFDRYGLTAKVGEPSVINQPVETALKASMPGEAPIGFPFNWGSKWDDLPEAAKNAYRKSQPEENRLSDSSLKMAWDVRKPEDREAFGKTLEARGLVEAPTNPVEPPTPTPTQSQQSVLPPSRVYHGTQSVFENFDPSFMKEEAKYGPGIYFTENPDIANGYAKTANRPDSAPNVHAVKIEAQNPFQIDAPANPQLVQKLIDVDNEYKQLYPNSTNYSPVEKGLGGAGFENFSDIKTNDDLYQVLYRSFGSRADANDWLAANGFDAITHMGGKEGKTRHRVWILLDTTGTNSDLEGRIKPAWGAGEPPTSINLEPQPVDMSTPVPDAKFGNGTASGSVKGGTPESRASMKAELESQGLKVTEDGDTLRYERPSQTVEIPATEPVAEPPTKPANDGSGSMRGGTPEARAAVKKSMEEQGFTVTEDGDTLNWSKGGEPSKPPTETPTASAPPPDPFNLPALGGKQGNWTDRIFHRDRNLSEAGRAIGESWEDNNRVIGSHAQAVGNEIAERLHTAFNPEDNGLVKSVTTEQFPNGMTIQDIAARLPEVADQLTPEQLSALKYVQDRLKPYEDILRSTGFDRTRADIQDGGFYLPRGKGELLEADTEPVNPYRMPGTRGGGKSSQKPTRFDSQSEAIAKGYEYAPLNEALTGYIKDTGTTYNDKRIADYLKGLTDEDGKPMFTTAADRVNKDAKDAIDTLRSSLASKRATLLRNQGRAAGAERNTERLNKLADDAEERANKAATDFAKKMEDASTTDEKLKIAGQEADALDRESQKWADAARKAGVSEDAIKQHLNEAATSYNEVREKIRNLQPSWDNEKRLAQQIPAGNAEVGLNATRGLAGPTEYVNEINKAIDRSAPASGFGGGVIRALQSYKAINQVFNATADDSFLAQQGAWAMTRDPKAAADILRMNIAAAKDPRALSRYLVKMTDAAESTGTLTPAEMAANGLHIGGRANEFGLGQNVSEQVGERLKKAPIIGGPAKAAGKVAETADQLMGYTGDVSRVSLANLEVKNMIRDKMGAEAYDAAIKSGDKDAIRAVTDELQNSGAFRDLFDEINNITGYAKTAFGGKGAAGQAIQMATFAPRWFQARLQRNLDALMGIAKLPFGNATVKERYARKSLIQYVIAGVAMTVDANAAMGHETDFQPLNPDGTLNPNFLAIRAGDRDYNLFGPELALARVILSAAHGEPIKAIHGLTAGLTKDALDIILKKDAGGHPVNWEDWQQHPENGMRWFASHLMPIGAWDTAEIIGNAGKKMMSGEGDLGTAATAAAQSAGTIAGLNSAPLSYTDIAQQLTDKAYAEGKLSGSYPSRPQWSKLRSDDKRLIEQDPSLKEAQAKITPEPVDDPQRLRILFDDIKSNDAKLEGTFKESLDAGATGKNLRSKIQTLLEDRYKFRQGKFEQPDNKRALDRSQKSNEVNVDDYWRQQYAAVPLPEDLATGELDYKKQQADRAEVLKQAETAGADLKFVRSPASNFGDPTVSKAVGDYRAAHELIQPYLEIRDNVMSKAPVVQKFFEDYMHSSDTDKARLRKSPVWKAVKKQMEVVTTQRRAYLLSHPVIVKLLDKYGYQHPSLTGTTSRGPF